MGKFSENHLAFFTKKENKENQTDFWALLYTSEKRTLKKFPLTQKELIDFKAGVCQNTNHSNLFVIVVNQD